MIIRSIGFLYLVFIWYPAFCQLRYLDVTLLDETNGLTGLNNSFIYKDTKDFVWISSPYGLYRFDGKKLKNFSSNAYPGFAGSNVNGYIVEDENNNIWFSTEKALNCYVTTEDTFKSFEQPGIESTGYFTCGIDSFFNIWLVCGREIFSFNRYDTTFKFRGYFKSEVQRVKIHLDSSGQVQYVVGINYVQQPSFELISISENLEKNRSLNFQNSVLLTSRIRDVLFVNDSIMALAAQGNGLLLLNYQKGSVKRYLPDENNGIMVNGLAKLNDSIWMVSTLSDGVYAFHYGKRTYEHLGILRSGREVLNQALFAINCDENGGVWISINRLGIGFYNFYHQATFSFYPYTLKTVPSNSGLNSSSILELKDNRVFLASNLNGVALFRNPGNLEQHFHRDNTDDFKHNAIWAAASDDANYIWLTSLNGSLSCFDPQKNSFKLVSSEACYSLTPGQNGAMLCASVHGGIKQLRMSNTHHFVSTEYFFKSPYSFTNILYINNDNLLAVKFPSEILRVKMGQLTILSDSLAIDCDIICMVKDTALDVVWIGSDKGLYFIDEDSFELKSIAWASNKLSSYAVMGIIPIADSLIWLSTNKGILCIDRIKQQIVAYDKSFGTGANEFNRGSFLHHSNGELWFGSTEGITVKKNGNIYNYEDNSRVNITNILVNDEQLSFSNEALTYSKNINEPFKLKLSYGSNTVSFEFASFNYGGIGKSNYVYKMEGSDKSWVKNGNQGFARYANMRPGHYVFNVKLDNGRTENNNTTTSIHVIIIPPVYFRLWFIICLVLLGLFLMWFVFSAIEKRKRRIQQLIFDKKLALESERLRISNDMHDDLGSGLSALQLRAKILSQQVVDPALKSQVKELEDNADMLTQKIRETIWTISSKNDTIDSLVTRLHQYALDYFENSGIECSVKLMPEQNLTPIPGSVRKEIFLAFKEALHNIYKHAKASDVHIQLYVEAPNKLIISISDNGIGFKADESTRGLGLASMKKRILEIGGSFDLTSAADGTRITFRYSYS